MSRQRKLFWIVFCVVALVGLPSVVPAQQAAQQDGEAVYLALPTDVFVIVDQSLVLITGRPTSTTPLVCAPGTPQTSSAVVVDEGGGNAAQQTAVWVFRNTEPRAGTRIRIVGGPYACSTDFRLWDGVIE